ncbi:phenoloxidase-activating factor 2 [Stomoxys calcitrans]|uniref:phenoloxidase-activating factor 2 n=1 Tax=Stomoxys calcitrans TaxID=35570 RepID=UPI0027E36A87|nr:phenoloxidase-activating factor 2 [Stomoxys calcitrans]
MFPRRLNLVLILSFLVYGNALPQQSTGTYDPDITALVDNVFGQPNQQQQQQQQQQQPQQPATQTTRKPTGFANIVTPDPIGANTQFNSISGRSQCNCVPYHLCDPSNNTPATMEDDIFDGFGLIDIRFNRDDDPVCAHFLDVCCDGNHTRSESLNPKPQEERPNRPKGCGVRNVGGIDFNITGANDNEAGFGEFPWTVALLNSRNSSYFCAGSLIHPRVVLTGVHCVIGQTLDSFVVRAGEWDTQTVKERLAYEESAPSKVITHPQYNSRNVANDFALVILRQPFTLGDHINVVCLPPANSSPAARTTCFSTGWGKDQFGAKGRYSAIMKRLPLPIVDYNTCQTQLRGTRLGPKFALDRSFICAGGQAGIDTCQGDGGAPLVCPIGQAGDNRYQQSGIVAWGIGCNDPIPAAYAHVGLARDWIDEQMYANGFDTTAYSV